MANRKRVAIIGAGSSGLCAAKHLLSPMIPHEKEVEFEPVIFEQNNAVGGSWVYEEVTKEKECFSSIYKSLKTNIPKEAMYFPDFRFPDEEPSFVHHTIVLKYLQDYAEHYNLIPHIRFRTKVLSVDPLIENETLKWCRWSVKYRQDGCQEQQEEFDMVIVCNGHYSVPNHPEIPGLNEHYQGTRLHSHYYRDPEHYRGTKNAIVLGGGLSGHDLSLELSSFCEKVYLCHKKDSKVCHNAPKNIQEKPNISHVNENGDFVLTNDEVIRNVDLLLICTGYHLDFPFLDPKIRLSTTGSRRALDKLYQHMVHVDYPSLCFIGVPSAILPFPLFHQQCGYVASIFADTSKLPSKAEMEEDIQTEKSNLIASGKPEKYLHQMGMKYPVYIDKLAAMSGIPKNPAVHMKLFTYLFKIYLDVRYKEIEFKQLDENDFEVVKSLDQIPLI